MKIARGLLCFLLLSCTLTSIGAHAATVECAILKNGKIKSVIPSLVGSADSFDGCYAMVKDDTATEDTNYFKSVYSLVGIATSANKYVVGYPCNYVLGTQTINCKTK